MCARSLTARAHTESANILLTSDGHVKLTDFGLAAQLTTEFRERTTVLGTADFMAPEIIARKPYGVKVDIWAIGMLCIELINRTTPFHGLPPKAVLDRLQAFGPPKMPSSGKAKKASSLMKQFVETCLVMDPEKRPSATQLGKHPWIVKKSCQPHAMVPLNDTLKAGGKHSGGCVVV